MDNEKCCSSWREPKVIIGLIAIILLAGVIVISILRDRIVNDPQWQVSVTGQGKVTYQPDIANISLGVKIDKTSKAEDALTQLNDKMNKVIAALEKTGISKEDIQTMDYTLIPNYDTVENVTKLSGYTANQTIVIKAREIQKDQKTVSKIVAEGTKAGANQINGIVFEASNINDLKQEARIKAINDARNKAGSLASALGVRLGKVIGWWENYIAPDTGQMMADGKGGMGGGGIIPEPSVPSGTRELIIEVSVNYKIK